MSAIFFGHIGKISPGRPHLTYADKSEIVLRWEIDNAAAKLATGRMESEVFEKGGFRWTAATLRTADPDLTPRPGVRSDDKAAFSLRCERKCDLSWKCEVKVYAAVLKKDGGKVCLCGESFPIFDELNRDFYRLDSMCWVKNSDYWSLEDCINNDKITIELRINFISSERFTLRWEIDNATAKLAAGRMESEVFEEGGFKWTIVGERLSDPDGIQRTADKAQFTLKCDAERRQSWYCEAEVETFIMTRFDMTQGFFDKERFEFNVQRCCFSYNGRLCWVQDTRYWSLDECKIIDNLNIEFHINIISSERGDLIAGQFMFDAPNNRSDVILLVGDKRIHVSKEMLSIHSPVFEAMFFGNFNEKGKEEVEIKDVIYEEFIDLLHLIYLGSVEITDLTVLHILKLADRFQMERVTDVANRHLTMSSGFNVAKKLLLAGQYRLASLKDHCLQSFTSIVELTEKLKMSPEFANYSADMKVAICERIMQLNLH